MATRYGHGDVVKFLLDECRNCNHDEEQEGTSRTRRMMETVNEAKDTALHEAVRYNHLEVVKLLVEEDPSLPYSVNNAGETPLYLAAERGYDEVLKEVLATCFSAADQGPFGRTALHAALICYCFYYRGIISSLLEDERINKDKQDEEGWTTLDFAAHLGHWRLAKLIISKDKSVAYKTDNSGKTALHVAASRGQVKVMEVLISNCPGCCELVDERGWNVLHFAFTSRNRYAVEIILENHSLGNLINEKDHKGNTPFLLAASNRFIITHPKVDPLVFNNDNYNALQMKELPFPPTRTTQKDIWIWSSKSMESKMLRYKWVYRKKDYHDGGEQEVGNDKARIDRLKELGKNDLVVATLIATVTFAAGIAVPRGFISDKGAEQGSAILTREAAFRAFIVLNGISMILSSFAVFNHTISHDSNAWKK